MNLQEIKKLIELFEDSTLTMLEVTEKDDSVRLVREPAQEVNKASEQAIVVQPPVVIDPPIVATPPAGKVVTAPLVGTFYGSPSADSKPYVVIGSTVKVGDTLCLIEAMKTFNQIESDAAGRISVIHKNSGNPVEYGEPMFVIDLA